MIGNIIKSESCKYKILADLLNKENNAQIGKELMLEVPKKDRII